MGPSIRKPVRGWRGREHCGGSHQEGMRRGGSGLRGASNECIALSLLCDESHFWRGLGRMSKMNERTCIVLCPPKFADLSEGIFLCFRSVCCWFLTASSQDT